MTAFNQWNRVKQEIDTRSRRIYAKPRQVRYAHLGKNVGYEEDGKGIGFVRPVLILKKIGNLYLVAPMTTGGKDNYFFYRLPDDLFGKTSRVILSQVRVIDTRRLIEKRASVPIPVFTALKEKLRTLMF